MYNKNLKVGDLVYITNCNYKKIKKEIIMILEIDEYENSNNLIMRDYVLFYCEKKEKFWIPNSSLDKDYSLIKLSE